MSAGAATFAPTPEELAADPVFAERLRARELPQQIQGGRSRVVVGDMLFPADGPEGAITGGLWPGGTVYYQFDYSCGDEDRRLWREAAAEWANTGVVTFVESSGSGNYIYVRSTEENSSYVGMIGGAQEMNISWWLNKWVIAHEIGHALGLVHEHCRSDRDSYVKILWENLIPGAEFNFQMHPSRNYGAYDFESVMHYPRTAGTSNGKSTIEPQANYRDYLYKMGYPSKLSQSDREAIAQRYATNAISPPTVRNLSGTEITSTSAVINGRILHHGGSTVDERHFYWGPTMSLGNEVANPGVTVSGNDFSARLTGLVPNTTYYFISFAHNGSTLDMGYGPGWSAPEALGSFITPAYNAFANLTVTANPTSGGTVSGGGSYPAGSTQTISASPNSGWTFGGWNDGVWQNPRPVTVSTGGVSYTANFYQQLVNPPGVRTNPATSVAATSAVISGTIVYDGGKPVDFRAFRWGTSPATDQTVDNFRISVSGNNFSAGLTGLEEGRTYYFRAMATNGSATNGGWGPGWGAGELLSFTARAAGAPSGQPLNISTRVDVGTGDSSPIGGFIVTGTAPKKLIVRALGPSLSAQFASDALTDPILSLYDASGSLVTSNDNWRESQREQIQASSLAPADDRESAIVATLAPGPYTAVLTGSGGTRGIALLEVYDLDTSAESRLANISTRGFVGTGGNVMIGGFIMGGETSGSRIVLRAIGPSLSQEGVMNALANPRVSLFDSNGYILKGNDDWRTGDAAELEAIGLVPRHEREAALVTTLPPGAYTALVSDTQSGTGIGLVEIYHVP